MIPILDVNALCPVKDCTGDVYPDIAYLSEHECFDPEPSIIYVCGSRMGHTWDEEGNPR